MCRMFIHTLRALFSTVHTSTSSQGEVWNTLGKIYHPEHFLDGNVDSKTQSIPLLWKYHAIVCETIWPMHFICFSVQYFLKIKVWKLSNHAYHFLWFLVFYVSFWMLLWTNAVWFANRCSAFLQMDALHFYK